MASIIVIIIYQENLPLEHKWPLTDARPSLKEPICWSGRGRALLSAQPQTQAETQLGDIVLSCLEELKVLGINHKQEKLIPHCKV